MPDTSASTNDSAAPILAPGMSVARAILKPRKSRPFFGRHPWVLESAVDRIEGTAADGDVVDLISDKGKFVARGIVNSRSRLRIRLYAWNPGQLLDEAFFRERIASAVRLRKSLGYGDVEGAARLIFSEADGLSGLIVDRYGEHLVAQTNSLAMQVRLPMLSRLLAEETGAKSISLRNEAGVPKLEGIESQQGTVWGEAPRTAVFIREHGLRYGVELATGQKTGFYLDQRENRRAAAGYAAGKRVLDLFCYSGGFSLAAASLGQAREVLGLDSSEKAVALARGNAALNELSNVRFLAADCFQALDELRAAREKYGVILLDPPKFTRNRQSVDDALRAYHRINRLAVEMLEPEGILVTSSCSGNVSREDFLFMLSGVSQQTGRDIQVLEQRGASPDHPVSATCLESEYLKCFICRVR
ncbi:MAG: class I SAM-dependent rRNA methyltransferase [Pirellulales bacterium]